MKIVQASNVNRVIFGYFGVERMDSPGSFACVHVTPVIKPSTPLKIFNVIICAVGIFVVYLRKSVGIIKEAQRDHAMNGGAAFYPTKGKHDAPVPFVVVTPEGPPASVVLALNSAVRPDAVHAMAKMGIGARLSAHGATMPRLNIKSMHSSRLVALRASALAPAGMNH